MPANSIRVITAIVSLWVVQKLETDVTSSQSQVQKEKLSLERKQYHRYLASFQAPRTTGPGRKGEKTNLPPTHCAPKVDTPRGSHLIAKNVPAVMDEDPAQPPARNQPALGQASAGQDGDVGAEGGQRLKFGTRKHLWRRACCSCLLAYSPPNPTPPSLFLISLRFGGSSLR